MTETFTFLCANGRSDSPIDVADSNRPIPLAPLGVPPGTTYGYVKCNFAPTLLQLSVYCENGAGNGPGIAGFRLQSASSKDGPWSDTAVILDINQAFAVYKESPAVTIPAGPTYFRVRYYDTTGSGLSIVYSQMYLTASN